MAIFSPDELAGQVAHRSAGELGGWLTGPPRKVLMAWEVRRSERLLEGKACCATLMSLGNYKPASESGVAGCLLPSALCLLT